MLPKKEFEKLDIPISFKASSKAWRKILAITKDEALSDHLHNKWLMDIVKDAVYFSCSEKFETQGKIDAYALGRASWLALEVSRKLRERNRLLLKNKSKVICNRSNNEISIQEYEPAVSSVITQLIASNKFGIDFLLIYADLLKGYSQLEIAESRGVSYSTFKSKLSRFRIVLKSIMYTAVRLYDIDNNQEFIDEVIERILALSDNNY